MRRRLGPAARRGFTLVEILVVIVIIGVLAIMGVSKYTEFTTTSRQQACGANQNTVDKTLAVWESQNTAVPVDGPKSCTFDTNGKITVESGLSGLSAASGKELIVGATVIGALTKDLNVFVCPERANNLGGIAKAHAVAETNYEWKSDKVAIVGLGGKTRGAICIRYGEPVNGPDGTIATRHSGAIN